MTNYHRLGDLDSIYLFLTVLDCGKTEIKVPEDSPFKDW